MLDLQDGDPRRVGPYRLSARLGAGGVHTAPVVDADPGADPPWLATVHIPGATLQDHVDEHGRLSAGQLRELGKGLAHGLAEIHRCGMVHRDLKPSNVIMAESGPRIIDFGIARAVDASTLTVAGSVIGTYAFMSPEQITADQAGPASDVFSLGCLLAFAATGNGPFDATSVPAIVHRITSLPPNLDGIPNGVRDVVSACLNKKPQDRPSLTSIVTRLSGLGTTNLAFTQVQEPSAGGPSARVPIATQIVSTGDATEVVVPQRAAGKGLGRRTLMLGGLAAVAVAAVPTALLLLGSGDDPSKKKAAAKGFEVADVRDFVGRGDVLGLAFSPDGKTLAGAGESDEGVVLWDVDSRDEVATLFKDSVYGLAFSPDGKYLATGANLNNGAKNNVQLWDVDTKKMVATIGDNFWKVEFVGDGERVAFITADSDEDANDSVALWNVKSGERDKLIRTGETGHMAFSPDGTVLVTSNGFGKDVGVRAWNIKTGAKIATLTTEQAVFVRYGPDGKSIACVSYDETGDIRNQIIVWTLK